MNVAAPSRNLVSDLIDHVRREGYSLGDRLPSIRELSATLGFGRNAVRDGLREAQSLGFVKIEPRQGVFVQDLNGPDQAPGLVRTLEKSLGSEEQNLFHLIDARILVETELVGVAARVGRPEELLPLRQLLETVLGRHDDRLAFIQADEAFHLEIARYAGNAVLGSFLRVILGLLRPAKAVVLLTDESRKQTDGEHVELFRCLLDGDAAAAQDVIRQHLAKGRALLLEHLRTLPYVRSSPC